MAHLSRFNERSIRPNPNVGFLSVLPGPGEAEALALMEALAAQVKRVCDAEGLKVIIPVNSLEEYPHNRVFAGRNWNAGEVVELVLRQPSGQFLPVSWLLSVLCHELAHIRHMNHGPGFHKYNAELKSQVAQLRAKGHYGEGFWSTGQTLATGEDSNDNPTVRADVAEHVCGGAQTRRRPISSTKRRRSGLSFGGVPRGGGPSAHTGRQTARKRKSGARNEGAFKRLLQSEGIDPALEGSGASGSYRLDGGPLLSKEEKAALSSARAKGHVKGQKAVVDKALGTYRKQAGTRLAAELRAEAAEKRLADAQRAGGVKTQEESDEYDSDEFVCGDEAGLYEPIHETDAERRKALAEVDANDGSDEDDDWANYEREVTHRRAKHVNGGQSAGLSTPSVSNVTGRDKASGVTNIKPEPFGIQEPLFFLDGASESSNSDIDFVGELQGPEETAESKALALASVKLATNSRLQAVPAPTPAKDSAAKGSFRPTWATSSPPRPSLSTKIRPTPAPRVESSSTASANALVRAGLRERTAEHRRSELAGLGMAGPKAHTRLSGAH